VAKFFTHNDVVVLQVASDRSDNPIHVNEGAALLSDGRRVEGELRFLELEQSSGLVTDGGVISMSQLIEIDIRSELSAGGFFWWKNLRRVSFSDNVRRIPSAAFHSCKNLTEVKFSGQLEVIETKAFFQCTRLASVDLPPGLMLIGEGAFVSCRELRKVKLPMNVVWLGSITVTNSRALRLASELAAFMILCLAGARRW
jgi:hypothetical protein